MQGESMTEVRRKRGRKVVSVEETEAPVPEVRSPLVSLPHALSDMPLRKKTKNSQASSITLDSTDGFSLFSFGGVYPETAAKPSNPDGLFRFGDDPVSPNDQMASDPSKTSESQATPGNKRRVRKPRRKYTSESN
jgi:hypothetical protein